MKNAPPSIDLSVSIPPECQQMRLDAAAAQLLPQYSREKIKHWIQTDQLLLNDAPCKPRTLVQTDDVITLQATLDTVTDDNPEAIALDIVFEDDDILVINKPTGIIMHPGSGNPSGTVLNAILHHAPDCAQLPRAGIIHRLDKDTNGLVVIAKSLPAHTQLVKQLAARTIVREYEAIVHGAVIAGGKVDAPIGRDPKRRTAMAVVADGKPATTHYRVLHRFQYHSHLRLKLESGRTHQIRVHMAHIQHPIIGDPVYGDLNRHSKGLDPTLAKRLRQFPRQALQAKYLALQHPTQQTALEWEIPLSEDFQTLLELLKETET